MAITPFYYTPQDAAAAGDQLEAQTRRDLGLSDTPADWSYKDRQEYNNLLASRLALHPEIYGKQAEYAAKYKPTNEDLVNYGFFEVVGDFTGEFVKQGQDINPFAEGNRAKSSNTLMIGLAAVVVLGLVYIGFRVPAASS